jgi:arylsulfatase A
MKPALLSFYGLCALCITLTADAASAPNFLVLMGEAQGWASSSVQMDPAVADSKNRLAHTPALEALAQGGARFANFYAASPRCMPTRAALLTGRSPAALHMTYIGEGKKEDAADQGRRLVPPACSLELPGALTTIAELLKKSGYATAHFGKWHAGRAHPSTHGFDESDGPTSNIGPGREENPNPKEAFAITERGAAFMTRQKEAGRPFYLQISHYAGNGGTSARPETYAAVRRRAKPGEEKLVESVAMTEDMDATIGLLLAKLDALGLAENTYVVYTADHGNKGQNTNAPLSNGKGTVWEGGIRVPLLIRGPQVKAQACLPQLASTVDLFPTIAALAGVKEPLPPGLEGANLAPLLIGKPEATLTRKREELVIHFPHYDKDELGPASVLLLENEKLIRVYESGGLRLYNLGADRGERRDLAQSNPARAAELDKKLSLYLEAVQAQMPKPNPSFDASKEAPKLQKGSRKKDKSAPL